MWDVIERYENECFKELVLRVESGYFWSWIRVVVVYDDFVEIFDFFYYILG